MQGALGSDHTVSSAESSAAECSTAAAAPHAVAPVAPESSVAPLPPSAAQTSLGGTVEVKITDPWLWQRRIDGGESGTIFIWGANLLNYATPVGLEIGGAGMAGRSGPTRGIAREFYVGMPTSMIGTSRDQQGVDVMSRAIDETVELIMRLLKSGRYSSVELPANVPYAGAGPIGSDTGLGRGLADRQNGVYHPQILHHIGSAITRISSLAAPNSSASAASTNALQLGAATGASAAPSASPPPSMAAESKCAGVGRLSLAETPAVEVPAAKPPVARQSSFDAAVATPLSTAKAHSDDADGSSGGSSNDSSRRQRPQASWGHDVENDRC